MPIAQAKTINEPLPGENLRAVIGDNDPPVEERIGMEFHEALLDNRPDFIARMEGAIAAVSRAHVEDDETLGKAGDLDKILRAAEAHVSDTHKTVKQPYLDAGRAVDSEKNSLTARISGIVAEGDEPEFIEVTAEKTVRSLPDKKSLAEELNDEIPATFDKETGEVFEQDASGMTVVDEETSRELDSQSHQEGKPDTDMGEGLNGTEEAASEEEKPAWWAKVQSIRNGIAVAKNKQNVKDFDDEFVKIRACLPDEVIAELDALIAAKRAALTKTAEG